MTYKFKIRDTVQLKEEPLTRGFGARSGAKASVAGYKYYKGKHHIDLIWDKSDPNRNGQGDGLYDEADFIAESSITSITADYYHQLVGE